MSADAAEQIDWQCEVPVSIDRRWYLVAVAGTSLSLVSLVCNILIARVLLTRSHSHFFFLGLLAVSDSFLSFCYGPLAKNANCTGLTEYEPVLTPLVDTWIYGTLFRFYVRNIVTVFIPFVLLAFLNVRIVYTLRIQQRTAAMFRFGHSDHKKKVRSATTLLVLIVCSYLMANFVNVVVTAWEYIDIHSTQTEEYYDVYEFLTDLVSVLYIFVCATRLVVYLVCNMELREAFRESLYRADKKAAAVRVYSFKTSTKPKKRMVQVGTEFDHVVIAIAKPWLVARGTSAKEREPMRDDILSNSSSSPVLEMSEPMIIANANTMSPGHLHKSASS
ncbi:hypothetical protein QR680_001120 [Steinernema hermaphroditum]|uniref:G-protein coupled receptors family 1 profile domain-containing protein n=1 Tax=Steinernema hermaphroditum TaxID=289476 RepID=A0AA39LFD3_9BILA|nr:hypothetical protein QR680_001120 [Steinernema hermaphroditum]